jgi:acyl carrier protein
VTEDTILQTFTRILRDLLGDDSVTLTMDTRREEVQGWDSFNYVNFIVIAESELGVKFRVADVESFENVGAIVRQALVLLGHHAG